jgi:3',5'-cyclic-AMP phosphodiesterase
MKLGWLSDIHLNFLNGSAVRRFLTDLSANGADAWLISGDIGEADSVVGYLRQIAKLAPGKTYFTLGNHDFYGSSLAAVHEKVRQLVLETPNLIWLTAADPQVLDNSVVVVGDDGWADARFGNAFETPVELSDFFMIEELTGLTRSDLVRALHALGDAAAARLAPKLERAAAECDHAVILMHVPPFREAAWHQGRPSDDDWAPWFSCRALGQAVLECAQRHPEVTFFVLCGHTHGSGVYKPSENITVLTAGAKYGAPKVQRVLDTRLLDAWAAAPIRNRKDTLALLH